MFKELVPILRHRAVLMTITFIDEDQIRVNIVPKKLKDSENNALTTPITVTDTAEVLDAELAPTLVNFVGAHLQLKNTLESAKADMDAAAKAAQAEARTKAKTPAKKDAVPSSTTKPKDETKPAEPAKPAVPKTASLFDMPSPEPPPPDATAPQPFESTEEEELLDEIQDGEDAESEQELDEAA
jgi:PRTRC genetic system protein E